jgi:hypothetical protein
MPLATRCLKIPRSSKPNKIMGSRSFPERTLLRRNSDGWNLRAARQFFATDLVFSGNRTPTEISLAGIQASLRRPSTMAQDLGLGESAPLSLTPGDSPTMPAICATPPGMRPWAVPVVTTVFRISPPLRGPWPSPLESSRANDDDDDVSWPSGPGSTRICHVRSLRHWGIPRC